MGSVTGGGTYDEGASATLTATANSGYHFTQWQDGDTQNPRTVTVTDNATYTAYFEADAPTQYTITTTSANPTMGTVTGGGTYNDGATATLTATANSGYHFTRWQDNNTQNPRTVTVTGNATYTAYFEANAPTQYTITVTSANPTMGTVTGGGTYNEGATATLTATANNGYHFTQWQDGNTQNPRTVTVTGNATYTASFEANPPTQYTITVTSANPTMGTVTGGGTYNDGATATLTAMPNAGYHFVRWQDGNTQNPRTVTVTGDATYTAYFEANGGGGEGECPAVSSFPWNATFDEELTCWKTVDGDGDGYNWRNYEDYVVSESYSYFDGTNRGLTPDNWLISRRIQIPASGSYTLSWTAGGLSEEYYNENYSVYVSTTGDNPSDFTTQLFSETLNTPDAVNRSKSLDNWRGQTVRIAFRHHNTNDVFVLGVANVKIGQGTQGVEDVDESGVAVYATDDRIHVEGAAGESIKVFSIDGRVVASVASAGLQTTIAVENAGVYVVKVGEGAARKVVVIR